jgi:hypothetical protein
VAWAVAGKATQRPKDKKGKDKGKWESKGTDGSGDMDAYVDSQGPSPPSGVAPSSAPDAAQVQVRVTTDLIVID